VNYLRTKDLSPWHKDDIAIEMRNKMMRKLYGVIKTAALVALCASSSAYAGDAGAGSAIFQQCTACHSPQQGVNMMGPSLYGVIGRPAGSIAGYSYSQAMQEAAQKGLTWTPQNVVQYLENPRKYLDDYAGAPGARNKMPFSLADQTQREDVVAYLQTLGGQ
jgi:cytochrome c